MTIIEDLKNKKLEIQKQILEIQSQCSHPLPARAVELKGHDGGVDNNDRYWTNHECLLCELRWETDQRWQYIGDKRGMPDS